MKCLFCKDVLELKFLERVRRLFPKQCTWWNEICKNGHLLLAVYSNESLKLREGVWRDLHVKGRQTSIQIFIPKLKVWKTCLLKDFDRCSKWSKDRLLEIIVQNNEQKRNETKASRQAWLLCANRLNVVPDIRKLIGQMMNWNPTVFWDEIKK